MDCLHCKTGKVAFERSSGYAGYRCISCGHWDYATAYDSNKKTDLEKFLKTLGEIGINCVKGRGYADATRVYVFDRGDDTKSTDEELFEYCEGDTFSSCFEFGTDGKLVSYR